jgi:hypothetical protein
MVKKLSRIGSRPRRTNAFLDGNKRTALVAALGFLDINGRDA